MNQPFAKPIEIPDPIRCVSVLAVQPSDGHQHCLGEIFRHSNWEVHFVTSCQAALDALRSKRQNIVICEASLPDGGWKDILRETSAMRSQPPIIVTSPHADDLLWGEVLNLGGYDVLSKPFEPEEVVRITSLAWLHLKSKAVPAMRPTSESRRTMLASAS